MSVRFTERSLARVNVELVDKDRSILKCKQCDQIWLIMLPPNWGRMHRGWWICPNRCNDPTLDANLKPNDKYAK